MDITNKFCLLCITGKNVRAFLFEFYKLFNGVINSGEFVRRAETLTS
jgi:hypothetical protein